MKQLYHLTLRHTVLFFKDKGRFLTALITPIVLIVLYMTFLGTVYHDSLDSLRIILYHKRLLMLL